MRRFKLIKEYWNSAPLGTIVEECKDGYYRYPNSISPSQYTLDFLTILKDNYWQEIIEKDYEILSFINIHSCVITHKDEMLCGYFVEDYYNSKNYSIYSVKRLSDGEIFSIGDKVHYYGYANNPFTILEFRIIGDRFLIIPNEPVCGEFKYLYKSKQKLFTTEDGVDIFNHTQQVWYIDANCNYSLKNCSLQYYFERLQEDYLNYKVFSTEEKAEEYILMNKPCLSYNDLKNCHGNYGSPGMPALTTKKVLNLIKEKLNQTK